MRSMATQYVSDKDLAARYQVDRLTIWRWNREQSEFPRVVKLTPGCSRWKLAEIEAWECARTAEPV